uniref:Uncharacterized protein n=1 Tax=Kalanchoe fedtschenkoi TaxID=63787 RepID=A0A7N0U9Z9_KALFE
MPPVLDSVSTDARRSDSVGIHLRRAPATEKTFLNRQPRFIQPASANIHHHCMETLNGHSPYVSSLALSGKLRYCGSSDREIRSWQCNDFSYSHTEQYSRDNVAAIKKGAVKPMHSRLGVARCFIPFQNIDDWKSKGWAPQSATPLQQRTVCHPLGCMVVAWLPGLVVPASAIQEGMALSSLALSPDVICVKRESGRRLGLLQSMPSANATQPNPNRPSSHQNEQDPEQITPKKPIRGSQIHLARVASHPDPSLPQSQRAALLP